MNYYLLAPIAGKSTMFVKKKNKKKSFLEEKNHLVRCRIILESRILIESDVLLMV